MIGTMMWDLKDIDKCNITTFKKALGLNLYQWSCYPISFANLADLGKPNKVRTA